MSEKSKRVVITGGTGGLGEAVVSVFLEKNYICHVTWRSERELAKFALRDRVTLHQVDVTKETQVKALYASLPDLWGSIHVVGGCSMSPIEKTSLDDMQRMYQL